MADVQTKHRWIITAEFDGLGSQTFATMSSVTTSATTKKVWDGGEDTPDLLTAVAEHDTVILGRPWKPSRDMPVYKYLVANSGQITVTIRQKPTDPNLRANGDAITMRALLISTASPEAMAGAQTDEVNLTATFQVQKIS